MIPFSSLRNALAEDHVADYLLTFVLAEGEPTAHDRHSMAEAGRFKELVRERYRLPTQRTLEDPESRVAVVVDSVASGELVREQGFDRELAAPLYPVSIAHTALEKRAGKDTLRKKPHTDVHKAKLYFACRAMGVDCGFVVGKGCAWALVDFSGDDAAVATAALSAAAWAHRFAASKAQMTLDPPSCEELYPNMRVTSADRRVQDLKLQLALKNDEITLVRGLSVDDRRAALRCGITAWSDPRLTLELLSKNMRLQTNQLSLNILRGNRSRDTYPPVKPGAGCGDGHVFLDLETSSMYPPHTNYIFMIGFAQPNEQFECLTVREPTLAEERRIVEDFMRRLAACSAKRLVHWSSHEVSTFRRFEERHQLRVVDAFEWVDMEKKVQRSGWCPRGAFDYSLKSFAKAMHREGLIRDTWKSDCKDGREAMFEAYEAYRIGRLDCLKDIEEYNRVDVIAMLQIWKYMDAAGLWESTAR